MGKIKVKVREHFVLRLTDQQVYPEGTVLELTQKQVETFSHLIEIIEEVLDITNLNTKGGK